jgi:hypothetical protein
MKYKEMGFGMILTQTPLSPKYGIKSWYSSLFFKNAFSKTAVRPLDFLPGGFGQ